MMPKFLVYFYEKIQPLRWLISVVLIFLLLCLLGGGLGLTPFGLNHQTLIYQKNWNQALKKYVPGQKYQLNRDFSDYQTVVLVPLTKILNKNCENILTGLIGNRLELSLEKAIVVKNQELEQLDAQLTTIYQAKNDLWAIITDYNQLLLKLIEKYTDFSLHHTGWESQINRESIKTFLTYDYQNTFLYRVELNYLLNGDANYSWVDEENQKVFFQGLQHYEYLTYFNYLTLLDAFVSGSIETDDPILLGKWNTTDLEYLQFLKAKILSENFYYPSYFQAFFIERIANILLFTILPFQTLTTILFLVWGWFVWINQKKHKKLPVNSILISEEVWRVWKRS